MPFLTNSGAPRVSGFVMRNETTFNLNTQASIWADQLRSDPSFTFSDAEELKSHLLDISTELAAHGLSEQEAFVVASSRLGVLSSLKDEYYETNLPVIQLRKTVLVLSGVLLFFLLYFFMLFSSSMLYLALFDNGVNMYLSAEFVKYYLIGYQILFVLSIIYLYFSGNHITGQIDKLSIKPLHTVWLFTGILILAVSNHWLRQVIEAIPDPHGYVYYRMLVFDDRFGNIFALIIIIGFILLYKKHDSTNTSRKTQSKTFSTSQEKNNDNLEEQPLGNAKDEVQMNQLHLHLKELVKVPLNPEEAFAIAQMRLGLHAQQNPPLQVQTENSMRNFMVVLSGVLVYFFLYYLLFSSGRILFTTLQHFDHDTALNIRRTWSFIISFQWFFVLLTAGLYFLDKNLTSRLNKLHINPTQTIWLLTTTILLGIVDRCFYPLSRNTIERNSKELHDAFEHIFILSRYTFPFILGACFLVLFYKYYRDNVRIG